MSGVPPYNPTNDGRMDHHPTKKLLVRKLRVTGAGPCIRDCDIDSDLLFSMNFGGYSAGQFAVFGK